MLEGIGGTDQDPGGGGGDKGWVEFSGLPSLYRKRMILELKWTQKRFAYCEHVKLPRNKIEIKKNGHSPFLNPRLPKWSQLPKKFWNSQNSSSRISTWTVLDRAWDTSLAKMCNILSKRRFFVKKKYWNKCTETKDPNLLFGKKKPLCHFGTFVPVFKTFLLAKLLLVQPYERDITHFC